MKEDLKIEVSDQIIDSVAGIEVAEATIKLAMESLYETSFNEWSALQLAVEHLSSIRNELLSIDRELHK